MITHKFRQNPDDDQDLYCCAPGCGLIKLHGVHSEKTETVDAYSERVEAAELYAKVSQRFDLSVDELCEDIEYFYKYLKNGLPKTSENNAE